MVASDSTIFLREVNNDNFWPVITLSVHEAQEKMVASNAMSIAQAYFNREIAWFRAIYADDEPVGFLMLEDRAEKQEYFLWRLMVDAKYQGMGFGRKAMKLLIEHVKTRPGAVELRTSYVPGEGSPGPFYHKLGFEETGEILEGERVVSLKLTYADGDGPKPSSEESTDQILHLMKEFQEGYSQRDLSNLDAFMELFAPDGEVEVIGTNAITPGKGEWCQGREAVRQLVRGDWEHWGDVVFNQDSVRITVIDEIAWLATTGSVTDVITADYRHEGFVDFAKASLENDEESAKSKMLDITRLGNDLISSLLLPETYVWPFRFTAVVAKNGGQWRFHQMQFSFPTTEFPDERILPDE